MGYAPSGQELATAIASNVPGTANVSGGISSTLDVYGPAWVTFTYTGDGSDTVGSFASELENALNGSFLTTSYAFTQATGGAPSSSVVSGGTSSSTWILVGMAIVILLAVGIFFMVR